MKNNHLYSPHLQLVLERLSREGAISVAQKEVVLDRFYMAIKRQGAVEIGYHRPEGQSFNPRAARVLLILIQDGGVRDSSILLEALELAANGELGYLSGDPRVRGAFLLDRLRHLHLEDSPGSVEHYPSTILEKLPESRLKTLIERCVERLNRLK